MHLSFLASVQLRLLRIRTQFKKLWKNYLYQSFLATVVVLIVLLLLSAEHAVVIASIGSTAFIVFTMPRSITAAPRRVIGGHLIGLVSGSLCALIPQPTILLSVIVYSLAVGLSILLMVSLDAEHPPAAGTALGVAISGFSPSVAIAVFTSSIVLSLAHRFSRRFLRDLT